MTTTRKRALTAQIKPDTRNAIMDQLALAADEIERLKRKLALMDFVAACHVRKINYLTSDRWWHRLMWWRA